MTSPTSTGSPSGSSSTSNKLTPPPPPKIIAENSEEPVNGARDPFSIDPKTLDMHQLALLAQEKMDSLNKNHKELFQSHKKLRKTVAQNKSDMGVLKANQRIVFQDLVELKRQVDRTHKFVKNKHDEQIRDTLEAFREDKNIVVWKLKKTELIPFRKDSKDDRDVYKKYAFAKVKGFLPWVEEIDIRGSLMNPQPEDHTSEFRILIKFSCPGDAEKFRIRMIATGHVFIRKGMSKLTRDLCGETKQLAKYLSEKEDPATGLEYSTKYQFSIIQHAKGNKEDVKQIFSNLNSSKDWEKPKIRNSELIPFKVIEEEEGEEDTESETRSVNMEHSGQDYGKVDEARAAIGDSGLVDGFDDSNRSSETSGETSGKRKRSDTSGGSPKGALNKKRINLDASVQEVYNDFFNDHRDRPRWNNWKNKHFSKGYHGNNFQHGNNRGSYGRDNRYASGRFGGNGGGGSYGGSFNKFNNPNRGYYRNDRFWNGNGRGNNYYHHRGGQQFGRNSGQDGRDDWHDYDQGPDHGGRHRDQREDYSNPANFEEDDIFGGNSQEEFDKPKVKKKGRPRKNFSSVNTSPLGEPSSAPLTQEQLALANKVPDNYNTFDKETLKATFGRGNITRQHMAYKIVQMKADMEKMMKENQALKEGANATAATTAAGES